ncbi:hypothetical protein ABMA27_001255 [Loxostege sticticalis]|uniref:Uncharacterized protein n=1 Tax=Loxostege sticticalis TaxID=481309 RepID=A0ABR3HXU8_LOXSC
MTLTFQFHIQLGSVLTSTNRNCRVKRENQTSHTMSTAQILNEKPKDTYFAVISNVEETPRRAWSVGDNWRVSTTLWLMAIALLLWIAAYVITTVVAVYCDDGVSSVFSLMLGWRNGTTIISLNEQNTRYLVTY